MRSRTWFLAPIALALLFSAHAATAGRILLRSGTVDTDKASALASPERPKLGTGYYLVSLRGQASDSARQALKAAEAEIIDYVPESAYVVRIAHSRAGELRRLPEVEWVGPLRAEHKFIQPKSTASAGRAEQYVVTLFPGESVGHAAGRIKSIGAKVISKSTGLLRMLARRSEIGKIADLGAVEWIEPYVQPRLCNNQSQAICGLPQVRQDLGIFGSGQIIAAADAGLDTGDLSTISPDFAGRILKAYALRRPGDWSDLNGHGTHVIGSALGSGVLSGSNPAAHSYGGSFAGFAPEARLVFQSIGDAGDLVFPPLHLGELFQPV